MTRPTAGFTLVEVLVTLTIFAMLSVAGTAILGQSLRAKDQSDEINQAIKGLQIANSLMRADFGQMVRRTPRDESGARMGIGVTLSGPNQPLVSLVRNGWENPGGLAARSSLQKVEYVITDGNLIRRAFPYVDGSAEIDAFEQVLISGVSEVTLSFFSDGVWQAGWMSGRRLAALYPEAVAIEFSSQALGNVRQLFLAPGGQL